MACNMAHGERRFVCVEHPARVKNVDKMLETLGGIEKLSQTYSNPSHRLELKFRPQDEFCKPVYGDRINTTNLLMKVSRKKGSSEWKSDILGFVKTTYKFQSMCDIQYLPMARDQSGNYNSISDQLLPKKIEPPEWLKAESPLFILPPIFSRIDNPIEFYFRKDPTHRKDPSTDEISPDYSSHCLRQIRTLHSYNIPFEEPNIPTEPMQGAVKQFQIKLHSDEMLETVKELFKERPIWPRNAIVVNTKYRLADVKILLPVVAYAFTSGPWRSLWIRFGYDPRKDNTSKIYQSLDFRVRQSTKVNIKTKRSACVYVLPNKINQSAGRVPVIQTDAMDQVTSEETEEEKLQRLEKTYRFRPTVCPPVRQTFYQFYDIDVPEVQRLVAECVPPAVCHERHGWLNNSIYDECRNILFNIVQELCKEMEKSTISEKNKTENIETEMQTS